MYNDITMVTATSRLEVMKSIQHSEEYYKQAFKSKGVDIQELSHAEICTFVASMKAIEADILIYMAKTQEQLSDEEIEDFVRSLIEKGIR